MLSAEYAVVQFMECGQIESLWVQAGGPSGDESEAADVAMAESGGNTDAVNHDSNGTEDIGLWQINSSHGAQATFDPLGNAEAAIDISDYGANWTPWATYDNGEVVGICAPDSAAPAPEPATSATVPMPSVRHERSHRERPIGISSDTVHITTVPVQRFRSATGNYGPIQPHVPVRRENRLELPGITGLSALAAAGTVTLVSKKKGSKMTDRLMYDSTTLDPIPANAQIVAFYPYAFPPTAEQLDKFSKETVLVRIDNQGDHPLECGILDVESGAASVAEAPAWVKARVESGHVATLYCNRDTLPALQKACKGLEYKLWIADPTGTKHMYDVPDGVATQFAWPGRGLPNDESHHYDLSVVVDDEWHPSPKPEHVTSPQEPIRSAPEDVSAPAETSDSTVAGIVSYVANGQIAQQRVQTSDGKNWERV